MEEGKGVKEGEGEREANRKILLNTENKLRVEGGVWGKGKMGDGP